MKKLTFFAHDLSKQGVSPSKEKISAIENAKSSKNVSEARSFLGLTQYSSRSIPDLATLARPIQDLVERSVRFVWSQEQEHAFYQVKKAFTHPNVLAYVKNDCKTTVELYM